MRLGLAGMAVGGGLTGRGFKVILLSLFVTALAVYTLVDYGFMRRHGVDLKRQIPFKCTNCNAIVHYTLGELQKDVKLEDFPRFAGPMAPSAEKSASPAAAGPPAPGTTAGESVPPGHTGEGHLLGPLMGPLVLECPKCKQKTLTQAVGCPKCGEIFILQMDFAQGKFDDKCPKCHESYAKSWQEKYREKNGEE